jgi:hypothetical protein
MWRTRASVVGSSYYEIGEDGAIRRTRSMVSNCNFWMALGKSHVALHPATIVRREALEELGGFDGTTRFGADTDFFLRAARLFTLRNVREALYYYRLRAKSLTGDPRTGLGSEARQAYVDRRKAFVRTCHAVHDRTALRELLRAPANDIAFDLTDVHPAPRRATSISR